MAAGASHRSHQELPDLGRQGLELGAVQPAKSLGGEPVQGGRYRRRAGGGRRHQGGQWVLTRARRDWRSELIEAMTADGS